MCFSILGHTDQGRAVRTGPPPVAPQRFVLPAAGGPAPSATSPAASAPPLDPKPSDSGHWWLELEANQLWKNRCKQRACYFIKSPMEAHLHTWIIHITLCPNCIKGQLDFYFKIGLFNMKRLDHLIYSKNKWMLLTSGTTESELPVWVACGQGRKKYSISLFISIK